MTIYKVISVSLFFAFWIIFIEKSSFEFFCLLPQELGLIRKPASFMTSICDERGSELLYAGTPITDIFKEDMGIGGVLSLLWFQRRSALIFSFTLYVQPGFYTKAKVELTLSFTRCLFFITVSNVCCSPIIELITSESQ